MGVIVTCTQCGKRGIFLPVNNLGHCEDCINANKAAFRGEYISNSADTKHYSFRRPPEDISEKNWITTLLLCVLLGFLGIHRFYVNRPLSGLVWLLTGGCLGIGYIIDIVNIASGTFKDSEGAVILSDNQRSRLQGPVSSKVSSDPIDQLKKLADLHAAGVLSDDEFTAKKAVLLERIN